MGLRQDRLADQIRDLISMCFLGGQMNDPRLEGVTITHVRLTADLQLATVYFRVFDHGKVEEAKEGLFHCKGLLRRQLADNLTLRRVPNLRFLYDESVEHGSRIEQLIQEVKNN